MKFKKSPNVATAIDLLHSMANKKLSYGPLKVTKPLALYGAGELGRMANEYFSKLGISINYVVDVHADTHKNNQFWQGVSIVFPEEVSDYQRKHDLLAICIVTTPYVSLAELLSRQGWKHIVPFYDIAEAYRDRHPLSNGWFANSLTQADFENISVILKRWVDDVSRAHYLQFIAWRLFREEWLFSDALVSTKDRFFIPEIVECLTEQEFFADVGAHHGNVSLRFLKETGNRLKYLWAIEPDPQSLKQLRAVFSKLDAETQQKIQIIPAAVGCTKRLQRFYTGLGYASQFSELGQDLVKVETIDQLGILPTFLKLHLEGAELDALMGAKETIHRCRPVIVLTTYHNQDGLWKIPKWLMENLDNYHFSMRLHSWCGTGSVIYCIPEERGGNR